MLTEHQRHHVQAMQREHSRSDDPLRRLLIHLLDGREEWPDEDLEPSEIHDWLEQPELREEIRAVLAERRENVEQKERRAHRRAERLAERFP